MNNVTPISDRKKQLKVKDIICATSAMIDNPHQTRGDWPAFPFRFHILQDPRGERIILRESDDRVVTQVSPKLLDAAIQHYWTRLAGGVVGIQTPKTVRDTRDYWTLAASPIASDRIKPVAFRSDPAMTYHRLEFDPKWEPQWRLEKECPLFNEMMERTTNAEALMTWIGSLFNPKANRQQYVWLVGKGGDGKGSLIRRLEKIFGPAFASEQPPTRGDRFWTAGLIGKRLVCFGDMDSADFVTTGLFKSLTGEDMVRVEFKGGATVSLALPLMFLISSNLFPEIVSIADQRRIILAEIARPIRLYEGDYEEGLEKEMPRFISYCMFRYNMQRGSRMIECDTQGAMNIARQATAEWDTIIEHHFSANGNSDEDLVSAEMMETILRHYCDRSRRERDKLRAYICEQFGCSGSSPRKINGQSVRVYPGIHLTARAPFTGKT